MSDRVQPTVHTSKVVPPGDVPEEVRAWASIPPATSIGSLLADRAREAQDKGFLTCGGDSLSFADVEERSNQFANWLISKGIRKGDRVALMLKNGFAFPIGWFGIAKIGAVLVPINFQYQVADLGYVLQDSGTTTIVCDPDRAELVKAVGASCPRLEHISVMGDSNHDLSIEWDLESQSSDFIVSDVAPTDLVNLQYTSGTTGFPKACMLTHEYWIRIAGLMTAYGRTSTNDVFMVNTPYSYMDPQWITLLGLLNSARVAIVPRFSASSFWREVVEYGVTFLYVLGTMPLLLLKQQPTANERAHNLRVVFCSGIASDLHRTFEERWGVPWREVYGQTESGIDLLIGLEEVDRVGSGSAGRAVLTKDVKVVDEHGDEVATGEPGEMVMRGVPMMQGYWNKPEASAEKIRDGWLYSGDVFIHDEEGYLYIVGRLKDMIRRGGENIAAAEVEKVVNDHPMVLSSAAVAVPDPDLGEELKVFVQLRSGETPSTQSALQILEFVQGQLARFKVPRFLEFVGEFPLTPSQRVAKHMLLGEREDQRRGSFDRVAGRWL